VVMPRSPYSQLTNNLRTCLREPRVVHPDHGYSTRHASPLPLTGDGVASCEHLGTIKGNAKHQLSKSIWLSKCELPNSGHRHSGDRARQKNYAPSLPTRSGTNRPRPK
jgi:hypothetical protein